MYKFMSCVFVVCGIALRSADAVDIYGSLEWTDPAGHTHPIRGGVHFVAIEEHPLLGPRFIGEFTAGTDGSYDATLVLRPGASGYAIAPIARSSAGEVRVPDEASDTVYSSGFAFRSILASPDDPLDVTVGGGTTEGRAFGLLDAMHTSHRFRALARPTDAPMDPVIVRFPDPDVTGYHDPVRTIFIEGHHGDDFDVLNHECMHAIATDAGLSSDLAVGPHSPGRSSIPANGKAVGARLGWSEGLASWGAIAAQHAAGPTGVAHVRDWRLDSTGAGGGDLDASIDIENAFGTPGEYAINDGEGDENSVMRILWDLGDDTPHEDPVARGHTRLLSDMLSMDLSESPGMQPPITLHDFWTGYTHAMSIAEKADVGAVFEQNGVSPDTTGEVSSAANEPPVFLWGLGNGNDNDTFTLLIFDAAMSELLMERDLPGVPVPGRTFMDYTLPLADWTLLQGESVNGFKYVIAGSDRRDYFSGALYPDETDWSGPYWSSASPLTILVPSPGVLGLGLALAGAGTLVRRRGTSKS